MNLHIPHLLKTRGVKLVHFWIFLISSLLGVKQFFLMCDVNISNHLPLRSQFLVSTQKGDVRTPSCPFWSWENIGLIWLFFINLYVCSTEFLEVIGRKSGKASYHMGQYVIPT